jgi:hypothetical protein
MMHEHPSPPAQSDEPGTTAGWLVVATCVLLVLVCSITALHA